MADYQAIIDAIDAAILAWVGEPVSLSIAGRTLTYRSLGELLEARKHYSTILRTQSGGQGFQISHIAAGGAT